jgi:hypothetical protein
VAAQLLIKSPKDLLRLDGCIGRRFSFAGEFDEFSS